MGRLEAAKSELGKIVGVFSIVCANCGDDENIDGASDTERIKDARLKGWQHFPNGTDFNPEAIGWVCPDCNPNAPARTKLKPGDAKTALDAQRRVME